MQVESKHQDAHRTSAHEEDRWYAAYTRPNHEKKVAEQLDLRNIEQLLPLYSSIRQWKDRKVRLMRPLFPGYVFVRMSLQKRLQVLEVPGIASLVGFGSQPVCMPEEDIQFLRCCMNYESRRRAAPLYGCWQSRSSEGRTTDWAQGRRGSFEEPNEVGGFLRPDPAFRDRGSGPD